MIFDEAVTSWRRGDSLVLQVAAMVCRGAACSNWGGYVTRVKVELAADESLRIEEP